MCHKPFIHSAPSNTVSFSSLKVNGVAVFEKKVTIWPTVLPKDHGHICFLTSAHNSFTGEFKCYCFLPLIKEAFSQ